MTDQHVHPLTEDDVSGPPAGTPDVTRVLDYLVPLYREAIERHSKGEKIRFEVFMFPLPTEERDEMGNHQIVGMIGLYFEVRGAILNTQITATRVLQPSGQTPEVVDVHVRETIEGLLNARSQQLRQQEVDAQAAQQRGEAPPTSGVITLDGTPNPTFDDIERAMNGYARGE